MKTGLRLLLCSSVLLSAVGCYRVDVTKAPLYDDIMVKQEKKITDARRAPPQNPQNMPKSYKKPVFNNELMKPSYMQHSLMPADVRDAQGVLPPEKPQNSYPSLYNVPASPDAGAMQQKMDNSRETLQQDLNNAQQQQQQMMGTPPSGSAPSSAPSAAPTPPPEFMAPPSQGGSTTSPMTPPPGPSGYNAMPSTEKKTLELASGFRHVSIELLEDESTAPIPLPIPQAATEEPVWVPPVGMTDDNNGPLPPASKPEGTGLAASPPPLPSSDGLPNPEDVPPPLPRGAQRVAEDGGSLPWVREGGDDTPPRLSGMMPPSNEPPPSFVSGMPQAEQQPFAPALGRRRPEENFQPPREFVPPTPPVTPEDTAIHPTTLPRNAAEAAIGTMPEKPISEKPMPQGYVSRDNNPEPRDHDYDYVGLAGVPLQDIPETKPYIDGLDEEIFGYIEEPKSTEPKPEPTHEFGTPEIPEGAGHSHQTVMHDVGYADDPDLFDEEPFLLNPFKYDNRPKINHPDFQPKEKPKARPKRHEMGARFSPAYRYNQPEITGPESSSYYGYSYFKNSYND